MSCVRRLALPVLLAGALVGATAAPAVAESTPEVERSAWFTAAGGGLGAPQPTVEEDDLRVARALETSALSTLLYRGEGVRASLEVVLREAGAGTPDVVACPAVGTDWEDGGNQAMEAAPEVDCERSKAFAVVSEDGASLSFSIDGAFQVEPGTWSIALLPAPGGVAPGPPPSVPLPFTIDFQKPEVGAFVLEEAFVLPALPELSGDTSTTSSATGGSTPSSGGFASSAGLGSTPLDSGTAPVAPGAPDPTVATPLPVTAGPAIAAPGTGVPQLALAPAAGVAGMDSGTRLLALLALAGGSAALGYAAGQQRPGPRLIGGRARLVPPALAGVADPSPSDQDRPRGIGRFAKTRDSAPRRLR